MRRRLQRRAALLFAIVPLTLTLLPQLVVCIGSDGHRAIEPIRAECCDHNDAGDPFAEANGCAEDCTDTPLKGAVGFSARGPDLDDVCRVALTPQPFVAAFATATCPTIQWIGLIDPFAQSLRSIRSTVLLL